MKRITSILLIFNCLLFLGSLVAYAGEGRAPYSGSKEYERMKQLVGVWEGTSNMGKEEQPIRVEYRLTAGGSGIDPKKDAHMHALTISFVDKDHIIENWTLFENGKEKEVTKLNLSRVH